MRQNNVDYSEHPIKFKKEGGPPILGSMPGISERTSLGESEFSDLPRLPRLPTKSPPVLRGMMTSFHLQNLEPNVVLIALSLLKLTPIFKTSLWKIRLLFLSKAAAFL